MKAFFKSFSDSAKEFKNLRSVVTAALLLAIHTILSLFLSIYVTDSLRISISFVTLVVTGAFYGPVMGMVCGGLGDIISFVVKPTGPYFFGWTLSAVLAGLIYGMLFYKRFPKNFRPSDDDLIKAEKQNPSKTLLVKIAGFILPAIGAVIWFLMPFVKVTDKKSGEVLVDGTALDALTNIGVSKNAAIVAGIILSVYVFTIVINFWNRHTIPLIVNVICCFAVGLAVYTDKKTMTALTGFWMMTAVMVIYSVIQIVFLAKRHSVDLLFLIRCAAAMLLVCIGVNALLGTYWLSVMYGKGFAFYFTSRVIKNIVQMPINIILAYYVLGMVGKIKKKI